MSASRSKIDDGFGEGRSGLDEACLTLNESEVRFSSNGMEFDSLQPYSHLAELTLRILPPDGGDSVSFHGVVVSCHGTPATGYSISVFFLNLQPGGEAALRRLSLS